MRKIVAQYRSNPLFRFLARQSYKYLRKYENLDYKFERNGEQWLLKKSQDFDCSVIFDVGCNEGGWAAHATKAMPNANVHCFEINDAVYKIAAERFSKNKNVIVNNFGLSSVEEVKTAFLDKDNSARTSLISNEENNLQNGGHDNKIEARLKTGDQYVEDNSITHIDLLKIDTEGYEPFVFEGFKKNLSSEKIKIIQFEYGLVNIRTKFLLSDFYELLAGYGFVIGKLYPKGVAFKDYELKDENFFGPNYVAVHQKYPEIIETLSEVPLKVFN